ALTEGAGRVRVAVLGLVLPRQLEEVLGLPRGQRYHLLEALDGAFRSPIPRVEIAEPAERGGVAGTLLDALQQIDQPGALVGEGRQIGFQARGLAVRGHRVVEALPRRVAHPQVDVGGRISRVHGQHLAEAPNRLVVVALAPRDVAELAEALAVAGPAIERSERLALVDGGDAQGELDA